MRILLSRAGWASVLVAASAQAASVRPLGWEDLSYGLLATEVTAVAVAPDDPATLYAATPGQIYRSRDGGASWERVLFVRGTGAIAGPGDETLTGQDLEDLADEARQEAVEDAAETLRDELADDLEDELGRDLAEEIAEDALEEAQDDLREDDEAQSAAAEAVLDALARQGAERERRVFGEERPDFELEDEPVASGRVYRLEAAPGGRVLVASEAGLYVSFDGGERFEMAPLTTGSVGGGVRSALFDPHDPSRLHAGTGDGVFVSEDRGATWTQSSGSVDESPVTDLAADPVRPGVVVAATESGIYRSEDSGLTYAAVWTSAGRDLADVRAVTFDGGLVGRVYAGTAAGLLVSTDGGESFGLVLPVGLTAQEILDLDTWPGEPGRVAVATTTGVFASESPELDFLESYPGLPVRRVTRVAAVPGAFPQIVVASPTGMWGWREVSFVPALEAYEELSRTAPPLPEVAAAAMRHAGLDGEWFAGLRGRAARAPWLPQLASVLRVNGERDRRLIVEPGAPDRVQLDEDGDVRFDVVARWSLDRVVFAPEILATSAQWRALRDRRDRILERVAALYGAWQSLALRSRRFAGASLREAALLALAVEEAVAQLDALTGGWFGEALSRRRALAAAAPLHDSSRTR